MGVPGTDGWLTSASGVLTAGARPCRCVGFGVPRGGLLYVAKFLTLRTSGWGHSVYSRPCTQEDGKCTALPTSAAWKCGLGCHLSDGSECLPEVSRSSHAEPRIRKR